MGANAVISDWPSGSTNAGWPQEPTGMLMPGRVQGWPAGTQRASSPATTLLSQAVAWWDVEQYRDGDRFLRNRGTGGELLDLRLGSSIVANSNDPQYLGVEDQGYVYLPGVTGNTLSIPDAASIDLTGDMTIIVDAALADWSPSPLMFLVSKFGTSDRAYGVELLSTNRIVFHWSNDGTTDNAVTSTAGLPNEDGQRLQLRVIFDADNGAGGNTTTFSYSLNGGSTWVQVGDPVTLAGTATINNSSRPLTIGSNTNATPALTGKIYSVKIYSDTTQTTQVVDINCDDISTGSQTSWAGIYQTVTVNRSTSGRKSVAVPSRHKGGRPVMLLGTDDYLEIPAENGWQHGLLNFYRETAFTVAFFGRMWSTLGTGVLIAKRDSTVTTAASESGWIMRQAGSGQPFTVVSDSLTTSSDAAADPSSGALYLGFGVRRGDARLITTYFGSSAGAVGGVADTTTGSLFTTKIVRIGRLSDAGTTYLNGEFYGAAIWRRALTAAEIKIISDYMTARIA